MASKILVIEDDLHFLRTLETILQAQGFEVVSACDGMEALRAAQAKRPDIVILNPAVAWWGKVRAPGKTRVEPDAVAAPPIIVLGAGEEESERVQALDAGAADFMAKSIPREELLVRLKALQHRMSSASDGILRAGPVEIDLERRTVRVEGKGMTLAAKEFGVLRMLVEAKGRILTRDFLQESVWKEEKAHRFGTRTVDVHIGRLRRKLGQAGCYVITVRGVGYRFGVSTDWI